MNEATNAIKCLRRTAASRRIWVEVTNAVRFDLHGSRYTIKAFRHDRYNRPALVASVAFRGRESSRTGNGLGLNFRPLSKRQAAVAMINLIALLPHDDYLKA